MLYALEQCFFFRPCFSKKLPTTCSEQCCSHVVVQRIFQHIKKTVASLGSVFSLSSFLFSFLVVEQVRFFLLPFSFRPQGDWQVCYGKSVVGPKCEWFFSLTIGVAQAFFFLFFRSFLFFTIIFSMHKLDEIRKNSEKNPKSSYWLWGGKPAARYNNKKKEKIKVE